MNELIRQLSHLGFGILIAALIYLAPQYIVVAILSTSVFLGFLFSDAIIRGYSIPLISVIVGHLERDVEYPGKGTLVFLLTALFVTAVFPYPVAAVSILVLAVLDSVSTIAGVACGRHIIYKNKSAEGTAAGIIAAFVVLQFFIHPWIALFTSVIAGITELYSPVDDNMTIPLITALAITILSILLPVI